jgi:hypothetical protein
MTRPRKYVLRQVELPLLPAWAVTQILEHGAGVDVAWFFCAERAKQYIAEQNDPPRTKLMKTTLVSGLILLAALHAPGQTVGLNAKITSAEPKTPVVRWVSCSSGTNVACSTTNFQFTAATFYGWAAATNNAGPTTNRADVYLGIKDPTGAITTAGTPAALDVIWPGWYVSFAATGTRFNLGDFYVVGTNGDRVLILLTQ